MFATISLLKMNNPTEKINILFCCDTNYAMPLTVCITSIFENNKDEDIDIYILYSSLSNIQKNKLSLLSQTYNQTINLIPVAEHYFSTAPVLRWSKETYYRLLIHELLPDNLDRILYLDCDIIVNKSLHELFSFDFQEFYLSALQEKTSLMQRERLNLESSGKYFQAGVLLFDIQKTKRILSYQKSSEIIMNLGDKLQVVDQDVLNVMFDGKIKPLHKIFNNCEITNFNGNNWNRLLNKLNKKELEDTVIFHYATGKPWNNLYSGSCEDIWYKYLKLSPYKELYRGKFNKIKYKVLRTGLCKILLHEYIHVTPFINKTALKLFPQKTYISLKKYYRKHIK